MGILEDTRLEPSTALGRVVRLAGHDLRNNLSVMRNATYYLNMKVGRQSDALDRHLRILSREITICNRTIECLMDLVAPKPPSPGKADVNALIRRALEHVSVPEGVGIETALALDLPVVELDADQLGRAVENILAYQYATMREGDTLRLVTRESETKVYAQLIDSGPGLSQEQLANLLDAERDDGLSVQRIRLLAARRLVSLNHATLAVESGAGTGTRFSLVLSSA